MSDDSQDPFDTYLVVVNHEGQYSTWPADRDLPPGWRSVDVMGSKEECLRHIEKVWTDMRPISVRGGDET